MSGRGWPRQDGQKGRARGAHSSTAGIKIGKREEEEGEMKPLASTHFPVYHGRSAAGLKKDLQGA